jgi:hypothetical protein
MDWKLVEVKHLPEGIEKSHSNPNRGPGWDSNQARHEQNSRASSLDKPDLKPDVILFYSRISWGMSQDPLAGHVASYLLATEINGGQWDVYLRADGRWQGERTVRNVSEIELECS